MCGWLAIFNTWGFVNSFGAFQTYYESVLPESASTISWIGSIQACLMFFLGAFSGRALDAGYFRPTIIIGISFQLVGIFVMSIANRYWSLLVTQGILTGIGGGIFFTPVMGLMSTYFATRRGMALGIATSGNAVGGIVYPVVVRQLLPKVGFGWTVRVLGFINLASLCLVIALMKPRLPPRKAGPIIEVSAIRDIPYVLYVFGFCFLMASIYFVFYYIASFARDVVGLPYTSSVNLVIILNGAGVPFRILPGIIADRYLGAINTILFFLLINLVLLFCWLAITSESGFYAFTALYGMFAAAFQSLFPTCIAALSDDIRKTGTRLGMAFSVIGLSALVAGPIGGALLHVDGGRYLAPQIWAAISCTVGTAMLITARVRKWGWGWKVKC